MAGIVVPTSEKLPPGPRRDLVEALHGLYRGAGKPSLREISLGIKQRDELPTTVSHDTASQLLHGVAVPAWARVESMVRYLAGTAVGRQKPDPEDEVERFHRLWLAADDAERDVPAPPPKAGTTDAALREELRSTDPERRIAALYRLERLAWRTPPQDQEATEPSWPSMLGDFLREARPLGGSTSPEPDPAEDVQVAVLILGRLPERYSGGHFNLSRLDLRNLVWDGARLWRANLSSSLLSGSSLEYAQLGDARLVEATLTGVDLDSADLTSADLTRCDLSGTTMVDTRIPDANLSGAVLTGTELVGASAPQARLRGCKASGADFRHADLSETSFKWAVLTNCHFDHAKLASADLTGAVLSGCSFAGADLSRARFTKRGLTEAQLTPAQLQSIKVVQNPD
ncbi:pentapeptide repeat-containing protein [Kitasatospora sp. NPDC057518]|uniref:pentapeptide repeat-containing protein n=1 Tax=unclassified Kitasatospora TaxID=2633591 RepID=UPI00369ABD6A